MNTVDIQKHIISLLSVNIKILYSFNVFTITHKKRFQQLNIICLNSS